MTLQRISKLHHVSAGWVVGLVVGVLALAMAFLSLRYFDERGERRAEATTGAIVGEIEKAFDGIERELYAIRAFFAASQTVTRSEFDVFSSTLGFSPGARGVALIDVVAPDDLEAYERNQAAEHPGFRVFRIESGQVVPTGDLPVHYPVRYFTHRTGQDDVSGLDVANVGAQAASITATLVTRLPVSTPLHTLAVPGESGFVAFLPLEPGDTEVVAGIPILTEEFVNGAVGASLRDEVSVTLTNEQVMVETSGGWPRSHSFTTLGQNWTVVVEPRHGSTITGVGWLEWPVYGVALLVAVLAGWLTWSWLKGVRTTERLTNAEMVSVEKDRFLASVSHELRTPISAVVGFTKELRDHWPDLSESERNEFLRLVDEQSDEVASIVQDLVVATRLDDGDIYLQPTRLDLGRVAAQALESIPIPEGKVVIVDDGMAEAWADNVRSRQILRNLISNAVKYGGTRITISTGVRDGRPVFEISDDGAGVPPYLQATLFEPYQQGVSGGPLPSMGLGLFVSKRLARSMHGDLTHERRSGLTVFTLTLPAAVVDLSRVG